MMGRPADGQLPREAPARVDGKLPGWTDARERDPRLSGRVGGAQRGDRLSEALELVETSRTGSRD